ncbi:unnamed protein product [Prunus armeniaca]|uniref:Uncharacterized protein n=1 Tax=Prunus armeniaca TaxID=36596 RepID=A0A6J5VNE2_PRUAR|nr:unnamed protein product [Prunus armeniaca]
MVVVAGRREGERGSEGGGRTITWEGWVARKYGSEDEWWEEISWDSDYGWYERIFSWDGEVQ